MSTWRGERVARRADAKWCLDLLDRLHAFAAEHGHFAPETRAERLADLVTVLDDARVFYRKAVDRAWRGYSVIARRPSMLRAASTCSASTVTPYRSAAR